jgi:hypothetical protein
VDIDSCIHFYTSYGHQATKVAIILSYILYYIRAKMVQLFYMQIENKMALTTWIEIKCISKVKYINWIYLPHWKFILSNKEVSKQFRWQT